MIIDEKNLVADLVEFKARTVRMTDESDCHDLKVDLRLNQSEIEQDSATILVTIKRIMMRLELNGMEIVPGSRFGEPVKENRIVESFKTKSDTNKNINAKGGIKGAISNSGAKGSANTELSLAISTTKQLTREKTEDIVSLRVTARGNNTWEVFEEDGDLQGTYLNDDVLCKVELVKGANRSLLTASIISRQRDLRFKIEGSIIERYTQTQRRLMGIFIAKCLEGESYQGKVTLSKTEIEIE